MNEQAMRDAFEAWFRRTYDMPGTVAFEWGAPTIVNMFQSWKAGRADAVSAPIHAVTITPNNRGYVENGVAYATVRIEQGGDMMAVGEKLYRLSDSVSAHF